MEIGDFIRLVEQEMYRDMRETPVEYFDGGPLNGASIYNTKHYALKMFKRVAYVVTQSAGQRHAADTGIRANGTINQTGVTLSRREADAAPR